MISLKLQNLLFFRNRFVVDCSAERLVPAIQGAGWRQTFRLFVQRRLARWKREAEIERASARLRGLSHRQLRDMGITHADIDRVVRYGRDG